MKKYNSIFSYIVAVITALVIIGCVHDDKYDAPNLDNYQCRNADYYTNTNNKFVKWTLHDLKLKTLNEEITENAYVEGYVSSTDESGNIYKTIYIQDAPENPTEGLTVSVDMVSAYTRFPQGSKVYIELKGLSVTAYGNVRQLGQVTPAGTRILEKEVPNHIFRDCNERANIKPKVLTMAQFAANDALIGCLVQLDGVEFDERALCTNFAPNGQTVDKTIGQGWNSSTLKYVSTAIVRNSGYASFANQIVPAGKGRFVGIFSKYNSTYQLYINKLSDLKMDANNPTDVGPAFPRIDGKPSDPCSFSPDGLTAKTVAEVKQLAGSLAPNGLLKITGDYYLKAQIVADDATGNLFKYLYVEDATGGIKVNINRADLYLENRFKLGKDLYIKLKDLHIRNVSGELQLGSNDSSAAVAYRIKDEEIFRYLFDSNALPRAVVPTERTITQLTKADVGRWIKIKDLQFVDGDLGRTYADGTATSNRTLEDCSGNKITLRTSGRAIFGLKTASAIDVAGGKGDIYAVVSIFNDSYQLWIPQLTDIKFTNARCDGTVYTPLPTIYSDEFASGGFTSDWTLVNVLGAQVWTTSNQGNGTNYYAVMNGFVGTSNANEDWLISKAVSLVGKTKAAVTFTTDVRYAGNVLQVYATDNYSGNPSTTTWTQLSPILDTNTSAFGDWVSSGNVDLSAFLGKSVRIAFKYTSTTSAAATWEIDDFKIKAQ
ncbi:DUF5689 domain-containing protein [Chryseobacterium sp.]|uniref:DUF5689 domain-containing protein n=1 Tax=Chryseobacterium sp. TaxID=1871047 RepID=UPI002897083E|nr:DUF5689 domain-containing protein [Chryseobacterium sp.]